MDFFVIAEEEILLGFNLVGIQGRIASDRTEALDAFRYATESANAKVLILTEEVSAMLDAEVLDWNMSGRFPLLVEIPGLQGRMEGKKTLVESIREAIGISV